EDGFEDKIFRIVDGGEADELAKIIGMNDAVLVINTANRLGDEMLQSVQQNADRLLDGLCDGVFVAVVENRLDMSAFQVESDAEYEALAAIGALDPDRSAGIALPP